MQLRLSIVGRVKVKLVVPCPWRRAALVMRFCLVAFFLAAGGHAQNQNDFLPVSAKSLPMVGTHTTPRSLNPKYNSPANAQPRIPEQAQPVKTSDNAKQSRQATQHNALRVRLARPGLSTVTAPGLERAFVFSIVQDHLGWFWLGTSQGVYRYDGYTFTAYRRTPANDSASSSNTVEVIYEDHAGQLWVGHKQGLSKFDRDTGVFQDVELPSMPERTILAKNEPSVSSIYEDRQQTLWVGTRAGLCQWEPATGQWRRFIHDPRVPTSLSHNNVSSIAEDATGQLWIGTYGGGLNRFERARAEFSVLRHQAGSAQSLADNQINALAASNDSLWIATESAGLDRFELSSQKFTHYRHQELDPYSLAGNNVSTVYADRQGRIWVGLGFFGLARLDRSTGHFIQYKQEAANSSHLWMRIYEDREGTLWIGDQGLSKLEPRKEAVTVYRNNPLDSESLSDDGVRVLWEDRIGRLWVGTQNGLNMIERASGRVRRYFHDARNPQSLAHNFVTSLYEDRDGRFWVATSHNHLQQYDPLRDAWINWLPRPGHPNNLKTNNTRSIRALLEDSHGQFWLAVFDEGACRLDRQTKQLTCFRHRDEDVYGLSVDRTQFIYETRDGTVWISTTKGLHRFERETGRFTRYGHDKNDPQSIGSDDVNMMLEDRAGNFWLATSNNGLNLMDRATGRFTRYTEKDGLCDNHLAGLVEDAEGNLWLSAERCLARFNPRTRKFRNFTAQDGPEFTGFRTRVCFSSPRGELFFGGDGVLALSPAQFRENPLPPNVVLTAFSKFNQPVEFGRSFSAVPELELSWRDNFFSFEFAALSYVAPEKNQYAYRLAGFDRDWVYCGTRRYASYTNVPAGEYVFHVKAANSDGVWNETGTQLRVRIVPPLYGRWWFKTLVGALIVGLFVLFFHWRETQLRKEHAAHEAFSQQLLATRERFSRQLLNSQEAERKRIAAELHDSLGQNLLVIKNYALMGLNADPDRNPAREHLEEISDSATLALEEVRQIARNLRPYQLERFGLTNTLETMLRQVANASDISFTVEVDNIDGLLTKDEEISLYRIVQEAMNNILKHSGASEARIQINRVGDEIQLIILDNGRGFTLEPAGQAELQKRGFGLTGSAERVRMLGGKQVIQTAPGQGTVIQITINTNKHATGY